MLFNTVQFLIFLPVVVLIYFMIPKRAQYIWLLIASYYFYMQWNALYIVLLFACTVLTYISGLIIDRLKTGMSGIDEAKRKRNQKLCLAVCILLNLGVLGFFKYFEFGIICLNRVLAIIHMNPVGWNHNILLPVGISFYTLQALGYLIDVYRGDIYAEKNFLRYALFVSFFPQLVAGPIERSKNLLVQLQKPHKFEFDNLKRGLLLVIYGLFLKMVIADRAAVIVDTVYDHVSWYPGFYVVVAALLFSIQIYCDFYGYSTIARGAAQIMGIRLMDNFAAPYFSKSIKEFWRRWHISLSSWFKDYLYIPLGGNRKGKIRKEANLLAVFSISGFWHGASLGFLSWGLLNGIYQVIADRYKAFKNWCKELLRGTVISRFFTDNGPEAKPTFCRECCRIFITFILISFAFIFFRAGGLNAALDMIKEMISVNNWTIFFDGSLYDLGVDKNHMDILILSIFVLFVVDYYKYQGREVAEMILSQQWYFQSFTAICMIFMVLLYGCYGQLYNVQQFIYFQF